MQSATRYWEGPEKSTLFPGCTVGGARLCTYKVSYIYICVCVCVCVCRYVCMCVCMRVLFIYAHMCVCIYIYICCQCFVCLYVCMYAECDTLCTLEGIHMRIYVHMHMHAYIHTYIQRTTGHYKQTTPQERTQGKIQGECTCQYLLCVNYRYPVWVCVSVCVCVCLCGKVQSQCTCQYLLCVSTTIWVWVGALCVCACLSPCAYAHVRVCALCKLVSMWCKVLVQNFYEKSKTLVQMRKGERRTPCNMPTCRLPAKS
jgi:hypothetical protein